MASPQEHPEHASEGGLLGVHRTRPVITTIATLLRMAHRHHPAQLDEQPSVMDLASPDSHDKK